MNRPTRRRRRPPAPVRRGNWFLRVAGVLGLIGATILVASAVNRIDVPPRLLAPYLVHRASGHNAWTESAAIWLAGTLMRLDRGEAHGPVKAQWRIGAQHEAAASSITGVQHVVPVATTEQLVHALGQSRPGDVITLEPGTYPVGDIALAADRPGTAQAPITVRAVRPGTAVLEVRGTEGFVVSAPHWALENLSIRGACEQHSDCEHAIHVVGGATQFVARNNTLTDFNAHIKINGQGERFPDQGLIEGNTISNTVARRTSNPVTTIDLVAASGWTVRSNFIFDFAKAEGDRVSYGAFAKGGGSGNRFERNIVMCERRDRASAGWRVGLSLGGGGTAKEFCRDKTCLTEQDGAVIDSNLIMGCSDDGIYVNRSALSRIVHNTLLDTGGISVRFPESSADVIANLVDGTIRARDEGLIHASDNQDTRMPRLYLGSHPVRELFRDVADLDLAWKNEPARRSVASPSALDLCGSNRPAQALPGAFEQFAACAVADLRQ